MKAKYTFVILSAILCGTAYAKPVPKFSLPATNGQTMTPASVAAKPTILVFLSLGCPHNPKVIPTLNELNAKLAGKVRVYAMVNSGKAEAATYAKKIGAKFPFIADAQSKAIWAFGASHSLDATIITGPKSPVFRPVSDGIDRAVIDQLLEVARKAVPTVPKFNMTFIPTENQSGCGL